MNGITRRREGAKRSHLSEGLSIHSSAVPNATNDSKRGFAAARNLPDELGAARFYEPTGEGAEAELARRLEEWRRRREPAVKRRS